MITSASLMETVKGVVLQKWTSIKPDGGSNTSKRILLEVDFDGSILNGVFHKALAGTVITYANGQGRKSWDKLKDGQVVKVKFVAPASAPAADPRDQVIQAATEAGIDINDPVAFGAFMINWINESK